MRFSAPTICLAIVGAATTMVTGIPAAAAAQSTAPAAAPRIAGPRLETVGRSDVPRSSVSSPIPLLAFYYTWFDKASWRRAKVDYPLLGRYTSDDPVVIRQHVRMAKAAGINGFIVSWKDTPTNDRRLSLLMEVARSEHFKLAMIYQGLDFQRKPLPVARVAADFAYFRTTYAADGVFLRLGGKPLTVWSGTWAYSHADVARVVGPVRGSMLVLNTEKNLAGYQRLADVTDGDAYYWSSVNPLTNKNYVGKLQDLSRAIHARGQYWMAPFAPGFDARMIGGSKNVQRDSGKTLRTEYAAAVASSPDILGLISWNEFSENSYVEPSVRYGHQALDVLTDLRKAALPTPAAAVDSSDSPAATAKGSGSSFHIPGDVAGVIVFFVLFFGGIGLLRPVVRRRDEELGLLVRDQDGRPALPASQWRALPDGSAAPAPTPTPWGQPPGPAPLGTHDPWRALSGVPADPLQWDERAREGPDSPPEPPE